MNQDSFRSRGSDAKDWFLKGLYEALRSALSLPAGASPLVCVDKVNTQRMHREDVLELTDEVGWKEKGGRIVLVEFSTDRGKKELFRHCAARIQARGEAHHTLTPRKTDIYEVLQKMLMTVEPVSEHEMKEFDARLELDVEMEVVEKVVRILEALRPLGFRCGVSPADEAEEWIMFPEHEGRKTYFYNRRTQESDWKLPNHMEKAAWNGWPSPDGMPFFRSARPQETASVWELPPLGAGPKAAAARSSEDEENELRARVTAAWQELQKEEEEWRQSVAL